MITLRCNRFDPLPADAVIVSIGSRPVTGDWPDWCRSSTALMRAAADPVSITTAERARMAQTAVKGTSKTRHHTTGRVGNKGQQKRVRAERLCAWCGARYTPIRAVQRYCSLTCHRLYDSSPMARTERSRKNRERYEARKAQAAQRAA